MAEVVVEVTAVQKITSALTARGWDRDVIDKALTGAVAELTNAPELANFTNGVILEAAHQRKRWGSEHDDGKAAEDWFWLVGYLAGKALHASITGDKDKALHHTISTAAALNNWHASIIGKNREMRPGIRKPE